MNILYYVYSPSDISTKNLQVLEDEFDISFSEKEMDLKWPTVKNIHSILSGLNAYDVEYQKQKEQWKIRIKENKTLKRVILGIPIFEPHLRPNYLTIEEGDFTLAVKVFQAMSRYSGTLVIFTLPLKAPTLIKNERPREIPQAQINDEQETGPQKKN